MSLEGTVIERWTSHAPLVELIPAERLALGIFMQEVALPYALVSRQGSGVAFRTTDAVGRDVLIRFDLYGLPSDYGTLKTIVERIRSRYDNTDFAVAEGDCFCLRESAENELQEPDGTWHVWIDFIASVAAGVT